MSNPEFPVERPKFYDRKPTVDNIDDVDDEDGTVSQDISDDTDLTLHEVNPSEVTGPAGTIEGDHDVPPPPGTIYRDDRDPAEIVHERNRDEDVHL
ncbi:MAG TPA: hypothetical protein VFW66_03680 [Gemmatimonadales bacterium]|nr:hypothetical protein [Gemmatimonadales bacterium]